MRQWSVDGLTAQFLTGADQCLGEMLYLSLETVEDCELKVVDCSEELHAAHQLRSPVKLLRSPMKVSVYLSLLSIPSLSTRIVPLHFQAGGRMRQPNLGIVCVLLYNLCYLYSLVKMDCGVLFYLV